jgi:hypothetical protein
MAELTLEDVRRRAGEVGTLRRGARESLQGMIAEVDGLIRQKDQVRAWTKNALGKVGAVRVETYHNAMLDYGMMRRSAHADHISIVCWKPKLTNSDGRRAVTRLPEWPESEIQ